MPADGLALTSQTIGEGIDTTGAPIFFAWRAQLDHCTVRRAVALAGQRGA